MALDYCLRISGRCATSRTSMREFSFLGSQRTHPSSNFQFVYLSYETDLLYRFPCFFTTLVRQISKAKSMNSPALYFSALQRSKNLGFCHRLTASRNPGVTSATRHFFFRPRPCYPHCLPGTVSGSFKFTLATRQ